MSPVVIDGLLNRYTGRRQTTCTGARSKNKLKTEGHHKAEKAIYRHKHIHHLGRCDVLSS